MTTEYGVGREPLIDRLVDDLAPVRRRPWWVAALVLGVVALAELAMLLMMEAPGDDVMAVRDTAMYGWKLGACLVLALAGSVAAVALLDPVADGRRARRWLGGVAAVVAALALLFTGATMGAGNVMLRLDWREGLECALWITGLSLPMAAAIVLLARRAAPVRLRTIATATGLAAAGWGAFAFAWLCPHVDPLYLTVWYGGTVAAVTMAARQLLPALLRW